MAAPRRKISKEERQHRGELMSSCNWVVVWVIRRLFDKGWTTDEVAPQFERIQREAGRICVEEDAICGNELDELMIAGKVMRLLSLGVK
jgi:hypothetical protein